MIVSYRPTITVCMYPIGRSVRTTITLYPIGRPVRAAITLYPIGRPVRAGRPVRCTITLYLIEEEHEVYTHTDGRITSYLGS